MITRPEGFKLQCLGLCIALLGCLAHPMVAFAGDKDYPLQGKVVALGTNQEVTGGGSIPVTNGQGGGGTGVETRLHRTYTVKSSTRVYVLKCPYLMNRTLASGFHIFEPSECGGKKKIAIDDVIHFRIVKNRAYIQTDNGKEQKLSVLSEAANEDPSKKESNP